MDALTPPRFDNLYGRLPERFYERRAPVPVAAPRLTRLNEALARELGLDPAWLASPEGVSMLSGNAVPAGAEPLAMAYAGHQFGNFVPQLGDGRAILIGEVVDRQGRRRDIALKGSGRTRFSRGGDGRAALGPVLREYLVSEAMAALNIPTTRTLAAVTTGEPVYRETVLPGAVLTRVAASHLRVGTVQFFAARGDIEALRLLVDHALARHAPERLADPGEAASPARALLTHTVAAQARLIASWLLVGFIHGVMNTDNMTLSGETIDYGPCAFMDAYDTKTVYSSIDQFGRYAYGNQPTIGLWNLIRLAEALLPLLAREAGLTELKDAVPLAEEVLAAFQPLFSQAYEAGLAAKIGLDPGPDGGLREGDAALTAEWLSLMARYGADFTLSFRRLGHEARQPGPESPGAVPATLPVVDEAFWQDAELIAWLDRWRARLAEGGEGALAAAAARMAAVNPVYIPRNHLVEEALAAATGSEEGDLHAADLGPFDRLLARVTDPYAERPDALRYAQPAQPHERVLATFCGT